MLFLALVMSAEAAWFHPGRGPERAEISARSTIDGVPVERTGALVARVDDPAALADLGEVEILAGDGHVVRLVPGEGIDEVELSDDLWAREDVEWAHPDLVLPLVLHDLPDDPFVEDQWHLTNTGQEGYTPGVDLGAETAWAITTGEGALIAIIDTGIDSEHPDLHIVSGYDYIDYDDDYNPDLEYSGAAHGTAAAGLAAAVGGNALGVAGVAYSADLHAVRLIDGGSSLSAIYDAFVESVDAGAWVLSNSWGYYDDCAGFTLYGSMEEALDYAEINGRDGLGSAVVFSAGNEGCDASEDGILNYPGVVGVAAIDGHDERESYSNYGDVLDISGMAGGVLTTDLTGDDGYGTWEDDPDYCGYFTGTSAAAPIVSGAMALMFAANPRLTAARAREVLCETAVRIDVEDGEYDATGWSPYYGCGRVDAGAAVLAVANSEPSAPTGLGPEGPVTTERVVLQWEDATDADGDWLRHELRWWPNEDEPGGHTLDVEGGVVDITGEVEAGDTVSFWVRASDQWGEGDKSEMHSFEVVAPEEAPESSESPPEADKPNGCAAIGGGASMGLALLSLVALRRRTAAALLVLAACSDKGSEDPGGDADDTGTSADDTGTSADDTGSPGDDTGSDDTGSDDTGSPGDDTGTGDTGADLPWGEGEHTLSGQAYFFDMPTVGSIEWVRDVKGAEIYVYEGPELRQALSPDDEHAFSIGGIPDGATVTLAVTAPDYFPTLTATFTVTEDIDDITFQVVSDTIATLASGLLGVDASDTSMCQMATTVTAAGGDNVWAPGEPDATVTVAPEVPAEQGPYYFNTSVIPDQSLSATTTDGGVIVVGATPGAYVWSGHKDGVTFEDLAMKCVGGWATNASPPYGMNVVE